MCCLAKVTFNESHFGMCMGTRGHFIAIKTFPGEEQLGAREVHRGQLLPFPSSPSSGAAHAAEKHTQTNRRTAL